MKPYKDIESTMSDVVKLLVRVSTFVVVVICQFYILFWRLLSIGEQQKSVCLSLCLSVQHCFFLTAEAKWLSFTKSLPATIDQHIVHMLVVGEVIGSNLGCVTTKNFKDGQNFSDKGSAIKGFVFCWSFLNLICVTLEKKSF